MKIAVQLSGQQRYGSHFPQFVDSLKHFSQVDYFVHHWDGPRTEQELKDLIPNVVAIKTEPQIKFEPDPKWTLLYSVGSSIFNLMSMCYGIKEANALRTQYEQETGTQYDLVIRIRPDLRLTNLPQYTSWFETKAENTLLVGERPHYLPVGRPEIQDQIAIGTPDEINRYATLYDGLPKYHEHGFRYHPESYFYWWLTGQGLKFDETGFKPEIENVHLAREQRAIY